MIDIDDGGDYDPKNLKHSKAVDNDIVEPERQAFLKKQTGNPRHLSKSNEHFTPLNVVEAARQTMGGVITLDPATTVAANERRVKAAYIHTKEDDGLTKKWKGNVFVNPPGGRAAGNKSSQKLWWRTLVDQYTKVTPAHLPNVYQAIFVSFSIELFQTSQVDPDRLGGNQDYSYFPTDFPFCIPSRRLAYDREIENVETGEVMYETGESPPHASAIIYLPESVEAVKRFEKAFEAIGHVCVPRRWA